MTTDSTPPAEPLKPCPLCGKPAHFFKVDDLDSREHGGEGICCETDGCAQVGLMWSLMEDAKPLLAERWNRRATPAAAEIAQPAVPESADARAIIEAHRRADFLFTAHELDVLDSALATQAQPATHAEVLTDEQIDRLVRLAQGAAANEADRLYKGNPWAEFRAAIATQAAQTQQPKDLGVSPSGPGSTLQPQAASTAIPIAMPRTATMAMLNSAFLTARQLYEEEGCITINGCMRLYEAFLDMRPSGTPLPERKRPSLRAGDEDRLPKWSDPETQRVMTMTEPELDAALRAEGIEPEAASARVGQLVEKARRRAAALPTKSRLLWDMYTKALAADAAPVAAVGAAAKVGEAIDRALHRFDRVDGEVDYTAEQLAALNESAQADERRRKVLLALQSCLNDFEPPDLAIAGEIIHQELLLMQLPPATVTVPQRINELIDQHGTLRAAARALGVDAGYLSRLSNGQKEHPSDELLATLGLARVTTFKRIGAAPTAQASAPSVQVVEPEAPFANFQRAWRVAAEGNDAAQASALPAAQQPIEMREGLMALANSAMDITVERHTLAAAARALLDSVAPAAAQQPVVEPVTLSLRLDVTPQQAAALTWQLAEQFADGRLPKGFDRIGFIGTASPTAQPAAPQPATFQSDRETVQRAIIKAQQWLMAGATGEPPRPAIALLWTLAQAALDVQPAAPDVVADARRYRALRLRGVRFPESIGCMSELLLDEELDAAIDAELDREGPKT